MLRCAPARFGDAPWTARRPLFIIALAGVALLVAACAGAPEPQRTPSPPAGAVPTLGRLRPTATAVPGVPENVPVRLTMVRINTDHSVVIAGTVRDPVAVGSLQFQGFDPQEQPLGPTSDLPIVNGEFRHEWNETRTAAGQKPAAGIYTARVAVELIGGISVNIDILLDLANRQVLTPIAEPPAGPSATPTPS